MTPKQRKIKARKFRLMAGTLYQELYNQNLPVKVLGNIRVAHDAMCEAFNTMEDEDAPSKR